MTDLVIVSGGLREPSSTRLLADRLAAATTRALAEEGRDASTTVVELRPLARDIADAMTAGFAPERLEEAFETVGSADGVIAVTPAFNASFGGLFKSFFDVLPEETLHDHHCLLVHQRGQCISDAHRQLTLIMRACLLVPICVLDDALQNDTGRRHCEPGRWRRLVCAVHLRQLHLLGRACSRRCRRLADVLAGATSNGNHGAALSP